MTKNSQNKASKTSTQGMRSEGFLHAYTDTTITRKRHKTQVTYKKCILDVRFYIQHLKFSFDSDTIYHSFLADSASTFLRQGMALNLNTLSAERDRVINSPAIVVTTFE